MQTVLGSKGSATNEERAVRRSYDAYGDALYSYVLRLVRGDRHKAEDIVQEALLRFWLKGAGMDDEAVRPWLFRVARNIVIDTHRRSLARPVEAGPLPDQDMMECEVNGIDTATDAMVLGQALASLSEPQRQIIGRVYLVGDTGPEVARDLNIPVGTVKSRSHYALRVLRGALAEAA